MKYDVVVVGAGPAGATAAKFLSEKGENVLLIDKSSFPRDKPCGGGLSVRTPKRFTYISKDLISSYSFSGSIHSSSLKYQIQLHNDEPIAAFVHRKDFDNGLLNHAIERGATFMDRTTATDVSILPEKVKIKLNKGEYVESQLVIGADGIWSTIAKKSGLSYRHPLLGRCLFQEYPLESKLLDDYFTEERIFHFHLRFMGILGYGWIFPKKDSVNIGIGEVKPSAAQPTNRPNLKEVYENYIRLLKERKIIPPTINLGKIQGGILPLNPLKKTFANRVILCGDAAGLMNPLTGDGIDYAMSSGKIAAEVCTEALDAEDISAAFLSKYQRLWKDDFGKEIKLCLQILRVLLERNSGEKYVRLLSGDTQIVDMVLSLLNNQGRLNECQWKLVKRFVYIYCKDLLRL
jgi:geranylgeranyl reductase family protein